MIPRQTLYSKFLRRLLPLLALAYTLAALITAVLHYQNEQTKLRERRDQTLETFAHVLVKPLWDCDSLTAAGIIQAATLLPNVLWIRAPDQCGQKEIEAGTLLKTKQDDTLSMPLHYVDEYGRTHLLGTLSVGFRPLTLISTSSTGLLAQLVIFLSTLAAVIAGALWTFERTFGRPLSQLRDAMHAHAPLEPVPADWSAELTEVTETYNTQLKELRDQARHDVLTGLPNRLKLEEELSRAIRQAKRLNRPGHVLLLDLDQFKTINDTHGHAAGDAILCAVAERLVASVRDIDTVARLGGDEFVVVLAVNPGREDIDPVAVIKDRIRQALAQPVTWKGKQLHVGASIGAAQFDGQRSSIDALLALADANMYRMKNMRDAPVLA